MLFVTQTGGGLAEDFMQSCDLSHLQFAMWFNNRAAAYVALNYLVICLLVSQLTFLKPADGAPGSACSQAGAQRCSC